MLLGTNHASTLPVVATGNSITMDISSWGCFWMDKSTYSLMAYNGDLTTLLHDVFRSIRTLHPKEGGPSRYHGALAVCRKAERRNLIGSWHWSQHPSRLNDTGSWRLVIPLDFATAKTASTLAAYKNTTKPMGVLPYETYQTPLINQQPFNMAVPSITAQQPNHHEGSAIPFKISSILSMNIPKMCRIKTHWTWTRHEFQDINETTNNRESFPCQICIYLQIWIYIYILYIYIIYIYIYEKYTYIIYMHTYIVQKIQSIETNVSASDSVRYQPSMEATETSLQVQL